MPRLHWLTLLAGALLLLSGACGSAPAPVSFMVFGEPAELQAYQELAAAFEAQQSVITIELIHIPSQSDYRARLSADLVAGDPADVVLVNYRRFAGLAAKGVFEPLGPYLEKEANLKYDDFYWPALQAFAWQGQLVCVPQNISSLVAYYNKDLFDAAGLAYPQAGWTWDDFIAAAQTLTRDVDGDGRVDQYGAGVEPQLIRVAPFVWQNMGVVNYDTTLALTAPKALAAVQWFVDWQTKYHIVPSAAEELAEASESRFSNGRTAIYFNSRRVVPTFRTITAFDWDVAPLPKGVTDATILHSDAYCLPAASRHKDAAWAFIAFANSVEGQTIIARTGRTVPSLIEVAESSAFLTPELKPEHSQVFLDVIPRILALPPQPNWAEIEEVADAEIQRAFYGEASVPEAMQAAVDRTALMFIENE